MKSRNHVTFIFIAAALIASAAGVAGAQAQTETPESLPRVEAPRLEAAPRLDDFLEMKATGAALQMSRIEGLTNRLPRDGTPMSERTEVYFGYDDRNVYAVFVCFDSEPGKIRAHLTGRDHVTDAEDSVAFQIDTFRDRKHAYGFQTNALGVQQDGLYTEGKGWDLSFDTVWRTDSRRTDRGYIVLLSVPFKSLRFAREDVQTWGFLVFRGIARRNEQGFWPPYSTRIAGRMNQAATLEGLQNVSPGRNAQIIPFVSGRSFRTLEVDPAKGGRFVTDPAEGDVGADAKVVIKDSFSLDLTGNPDFSQVESDEPQVTVNKRFETFFPEKRPFFLENASYFDTPIQLLFSRRIADPDAGGRLTGRMGGYAVGALAARDTPGARSADVFVLRVNRDVGGESSVGFFGSSRALENDSNRVAGLDARVKVGSNWFATGQAVTSATRQTGKADLDGSAYRAAILRSGRRLTYNADFNDRSAGFATALGFVDRTDLRSLDQTLTYRWMPASSRLLSFGPEVLVSEVRDHENDPLDRTVTPKFSLEFPGLTTLSVYRQQATLRLRPQEVPSLDRRTSFSQDRTGLEFTTSFTSSLTLTLKGTTGEGINLVPVAGQRPKLSDAQDLSVTSEVRPTARLNIAASYLLTRLRESETHAAIFTDHILRGKVNYQFTRALSLRAIIQYDTLSATALRTSLESRRNLNVDVLFTYLRTPGTALYVGYNNNLQNLDPSLALGPSGLRRTSSGLLSDGRQFFIKASYLLRK